MTSLSCSRFLALLLSGLTFLSVGSAAPAQAPAAASDKPLKVGVSAGPYGDVPREAARLSVRQGIKAEIIEFTDWNQPNAALQAGDIETSVLDVAENPKKLQIVETDAAQLPRSLDDVAAAFVTSNYAYLAGLDLNTGLVSEPAAEEAKPYFTRVFAAREDRKDDPRIKTFIEIYRSQPMKDFTLAKFKGSILPAW
ncbi:MetQ/NlpA family ABC transporter substrate-binding protein [Xanthobacter sp. KR7-225]|uniref:MetQ/NlpA family ABC transporter substrate-binding protein n=1 Tax=Xanthobacter sp. KR7-225 TaxID=3156613 RepID=UPI0032B39D8E